jgi:DNA anti-recombination protein RmuC
MNMKNRMIVASLACLMVLPGCTEKRVESTNVVKPSATGTQPVTETTTVVETKAPSVTTDDVAQSAQETATVGGNLAAQTKDEFVAEAKQRLAQMDKKIQEWDSHSDALNAEARARWQQEREQLRERQAELQRQLDRLQTASGEAWGDLKTGATAAWDELATGFRNAASHYDQQSDRSVKP